MIPVIGLNPDAFQVMAEPRGATSRLDPTHLLDLRVEKKFNLSGRFNLRIAADIYNLLNTDAMVQTVIVGTSPSFMMPDAIVAPRRFQIAVRLSY